MNIHKSRRIFDLMMALLCGALVALSAFIFSSGAVVSHQVGRTIDVSTHLSSGFAEVAAEAVRQIYDMPKTYKLPVDDSPAYTPNPDCYTKTEEDGVVYDVYQDDSIYVRLWKELHEGSTVNLAEVKISSPTQLRSAFAGGKYGGQRQTPQDIAISANAVVAINADYYDYRTYGLIIRQGKLYRSVPCKWDVLLIDNRGDFYTGTYDEITSGDILTEREIINSFTFGPATVKDGQVSITNTNPLPANGSKEPRTSIGQLGELHYLLATVDGHMEISAGLTIEGMAKVMQQHGCITAFNLDGGHSSTLVFNNKVYNRVAYGGQRLVSDVLYFGTGISAGES